MIRKLVRQIIKLDLKYNQLKYQLLSNVKVQGNPKIIQPTLFIGKGKIVISKGVQLGYFPSPKFYNNYKHLEARSKDSKIEIGENTIINNAFVAISEVSVKIGADVLIGTNVEIVDSDFHRVETDRLKNRNYKKSSVEIMNNVWIRSNVKIFKGVKTVVNRVVANGSIVTKNVPDNTLHGGIPARFIKDLT